MHLKRNKFGGCSYIRRFFTNLTYQLPNLNKRQASAMADKIFLLFDGATMQCQVYKDIVPVKTAKQAVIDLLDEHMK